MCLFQSQYRSVYMAVHEGACVMSKYIEGKDVMNHVPQMFTLNSSSGTTKLEDEFQVVIRMKGLMKWGRNKIATDFQLHFWNNICIFIKM